MTVFEDKLRAREPIVVLEEARGPMYGAPANEVVISTYERDALANAIAALRVIGEAVDDEGEPSVARLLSRRARAALARLDGT